MARRDLAAPSNTTAEHDSRRDHVLAINEGRTIGNGNHQQLLEKRGFYHHLYMSQFKGFAI